MDKHEQNKRRLRIIGFILLAVGAVFAAIGFASFFGAMNGGGMPKLFWCCFIGLPTLGVGLMLLSLSYHREIARYVEKEHAPVINEAAKDMAPAVKTVASVVKKGLSNEQKRICSCGTENDSDSIFCKACGKRLVGTCSACGAVVPSDAEYCPKCGNKI
ncbi:MAG: zinc ribbon domain-containing protein [Clostridia bacterium]|nr:zinc ribbon domain-containing protein [Clostridia bacterium]